MLSSAKFVASSLESVDNHSLSSLFFGEVKLCVGSVTCMSTCGYYDSVKRCFARKVHLYDLISCFTKPQSKVLSVKQILSLPTKPCLRSCHLLVAFIAIFSQVVINRVHFVHPVELINHVLFCPWWRNTTCKCSWIWHYFVFRHRVCIRISPWTSCPNAFQS